MIRGGISLKTVFLLIVLFVIAVGITGCSSLNTKAPAFTQPETVATLPDGPIVIPFFTTESDPNQIAVLKSLVTEYQSQHPNVEIDIILASPVSRGRRLLTALASGADLGIFEIEPTLMTDWVDAGYLLPLDDLVENIGSDDYIDQSLFRYHGHVYALPYAASVYGLWVRTDLLADAGLSVPTNYDELLNAARTLTTGDMYGIALPGGQNIATVNYFSVFLWQNGGDYFSCDGQVVFDRPESLIALKKWAELSQFAPRDFTVWGFKEQIDAFIDGKAAMTMYAGRLGIEMEKQTPDLVENTALVFPPFGNQKVTLGVWSRFAIAAGTRHKTEAREFLQWLVSNDRLLRYDMTVPGHMLPPLRSVQQLATQNSQLSAGKRGQWFETFQSWIPYTNHPAMNMGSVRNGVFVRSNAVPPWSDAVFSASGIINNMLQQVAMEQQPPEKAWHEAVLQLKQVVSQWKAYNPDWQPPNCN